MCIRDSSYFDGDTLYLEGIVLSLDGKDYIKDMVSTKNLTDNLSQELSEKFIKKDVVQIINKIDSEISK